MTLLNLFLDFLYKLRTKYEIMQQKITKEVHQQLPKYLINTDQAVKYHHKISKLPITEHNH